MTDHNGGQRFDWFLEFTASGRDGEYLIGKCRRGRANAWEKKVIKMLVFYNCTVNTELALPRCEYFNIYKTADGFRVNSLGVEETDILI
jgi:hypothetical protein